MRSASSFSFISFTTCAAVGPRRVSMRISRGPSAIKLKPRDASSSCRLLTPKSASSPSTEAGFTCNGASLNASPTNVTVGASLPSSAQIRSSFSFASAIASGSRSNATNLPFGPRRRTISDACPARPSVQSTIVLPAFTWRYSIASLKRTGTWRSFDFVMRSPWGVCDSTLPAKNLRHCLAVVGCHCVGSHVLLKHLAVVDLEVHPHSKNRHFRIQLGRVAQYLRQQDPRLVIHLHLLAVVAGQVEVLLHGFVHVAGLRQLLFPLFPLR